MELSQEQIDVINKYLREGTVDLLVITNFVFKREDLSKSSKEYRLVKKYIADNIKAPELEINKPSEKIYSLDDSEKDYIDSSVRNNLTCAQIFKFLYPKIAEEAGSGMFITPEYRMVRRYISEKHPEYMGEADRLLDENRYKVPKAINTVVEKVNKFCGKDINPEKLSAIDKKNFEKLLTFLNSPRFIQIINAYSIKEEKDLFESEFIRAVWDKPDLTVDELNLYINLSCEYILLKQIEVQKGKLNRLFNEVEDQADLSIKLTESIKIKTDEYDKCAKRIDGFIKVLNGTREERLKKSAQRNSSILALVEQFQEEESRRQLIQMAKMQKELVNQEVKRLENMDEWMARVLGIYKEDAA